MANRGNTTHWEAPRFSLSTGNQLEEWKSFYIFAIDFLEALDTNMDTADEKKKGWRQLKMMFEGEDWRALQTLINNGTISPKAQ